MEKLHVVLGANGSAGNAVVRELVRQGKRVRAISRNGILKNGPTNVEVAKGDVTNPLSVREICSGATVVYHCAQPEYHRWVEEFPAMNEAIIEGLQGTGVTLVFADNLYMYGKSATPLTEKSPLAATSRKGKVRIELAARLLQAHQNGGFKVVIGRGSDYFGPWVNGSAADERVIGSVLKGKKTSWLLNADVSHSVTFIDDFARGLILLGERPEAAGQIWHIPTNGAPTGQEFLTLLFEEAKLAPKTGVISGLLLKIVGFFIPAVREMVEIGYQFDSPFVSDASKFETAFPEFKVTPLREALRQTLTWYSQHEATSSKKEPAPVNSR